MSVDALMLSRSTLHQPIVAHSSAAEANEIVVLGWPPQPA
jgi:hypothetical protein